MNARRSLTGLLAVAVAASGLAFSTVGTAHADPAAAPVASDIVGVGSDTSQFAVDYLANGTTVLATSVPGYNSTVTSHFLRTFDATGGGTVVLQEGHAAITRPNGSGAGKGLLYGANNNPDVDFARSSSTLSSPEINANLWQFPFALDELGLGVAKTTNAPASLTKEQIVGIYSGTITNWSAVGGSNGVIAPKIPQAGSGTRSFFTAQLTSLNNGTPVTLGGNVVEVQEHDDTLIKNDPNAIAPFSIGRAELLGTLTIEGGALHAKRALYNVVRQADLTNADVTKIFGENGWVCSTSAKTLIEAAGFKQLAPTNQGGVCGEATQAATSEFALAHTPVASDVVGVGSDTSQFALQYLADGTTVNGSYLPGFNPDSLQGGLVSILATGGGKVQLQATHAPVTRPNGSGSGKGLLYGANNNPDVDFARSSSTLSSTEISANLWQFPFALDELGLSVAKTTHAPAALTKEQIVGIYSGTITNWSAVGGTDGTIVPMIPQTGSGTRSFFTAQLTSLNNGTPVTLGGNVVEVQEHDDTLIKDNPDAIAPFSIGRAELLGTLTIEGGALHAKRALYNVVRNADVDAPAITDIFGPDGFVCSADAKPLIEAAGFTQLGNGAQGGVCGEPTQAATSNFTSADVSVTTTDLTLTADNAGGAANYVVQVTSGSTAADGDYKVYDGTDTMVASGTLVSGQGTGTLTGLASGEHSYYAVFVPGVDSTFGASQSTTKSVVVKEVTATSVALSAPTTTYGVAQTATVTVTGEMTVPTGTVSVTIGDGAAADYTLVNGSVVVPIPADSAVGTYDIHATYAATSAYGTSEGDASLEVTQATGILTETFKPANAKGATAKGTIKIRLSEGSAPINGQIKLKIGAKVIKAAVINGKATFSLPKLKVGKVSITATLIDDANVDAQPLKFTITQK